MAAMPRGSASVAITAGGGRIERPLAMDQSLTVSTRCWTSASVRVGGYASLVRDAMFTVATGTRVVVVATRIISEGAFAKSKMISELAYGVGFVSGRQEQMVELRGLLMRMSAGFGLFLHNETDWCRSEWTSASPKNSASRPA